MNYAEERKKYEAEMTEVQKRVQSLDDERAKLIRIGVRLEGVLAFISQKERELADEAKKAEEAKQEKVEAAA